MVWGNVPFGRFKLSDKRYDKHNFLVYPERNLESLFADAVGNIQAEITEQESGELVEAENQSIPADPSIANFSYALFEGSIYYRANSCMRLVGLSITAENHVRGMIAIRDCVRELIAYQTED